MKKVSIIPSFNALPFLTETINSAFNQIYPIIEAIVIGDNLLAIEVPVKVVKQLEPLKI
jgi:hypothetical protein